MKIDSTEGILYRLRSLIAYLSLSDKNVNWSEFLDEKNNIKLENTTWAGHSDGAGRVAVLAKYNAVKRVVLFSGPRDFSEHFFEPPIWMNTGIWKTDKSNIYSFSHGQDEYSIQQEIWDSLGLKKYGKPVNIGQVHHPYNLSHQLITTVNVAIGERHYCTIMDVKTPLQEGVPLYESVWKYLLNIPLVTTPIDIHINNSFKIFPNPLKAGGKLNIHTQYNIQYLLVDISGHVMQSGKVTQIQTQNLPTGVYFLKLKINLKKYSIHTLLVY